MSFEESLESLSAIYRHKLVVKEDVIDEMNHVGNLNYLRWTNKAAVRHSAHVGWDTKRYREFGSGFVVRSHEIQYRIPALLGDDITVETWIASMDKASSKRKYRIVRDRDQKLLARAETTWAFIEFETMKLKRIPQELIDAFKEN